ncbi:hypothetical protein B0H14DRAFT_2559170 [Mycena olivaceomarginata]|nr:hypothetical protein B0H14DRAFT_2559170 [Mycena olivaceomarginata]
MAVGVQMVLANGIAGMSFAGSDVGGSFGNPGDAHLVVASRELQPLPPHACADRHQAATRRASQSMTTHHDEGRDGDDGVSRRGRGLLRVLLAPRVPRGYEGKEISMKAELHQVPVFVRRGSIVPTRERPRQLSSLMTLDPFTLRVALSKVGSTRGVLYLDDGVTYSHEKGQLGWRMFIAQTAKRMVRIPV